MKKFYGTILVAYAIASAVAVSFLFEPEPTPTDFLLALYTIAVAIAALYGLVGRFKRDKIAFPIASDSRKYLLFAAIMVIFLISDEHSSVTADSFILYGIILLICAIGFIFSSRRDPLSRFFAYGIEIKTARPRNKRTPAIRTNTSVLPRHTTTADLTNDEKAFLVNYLGGRDFQHGIDRDVRERFPALRWHIKELIAEGLLVKEKNCYSLTESGQAMRKEFHAAERQRSNDLADAIYEAVMDGNYTTAFDTRNQYDRENIIHSAIEDNADYTNELIHRYRANADRLDLSDCYNSEHFKEMLRRHYLAFEITGQGHLDIPRDFEKRVGERLICPALDEQLAEKCFHPNPHRMYIYYYTKVYISNMLQTGVLKKWDGQFILVWYDCTQPYNAAMAEYEIYKTLDIPNFPKTFKTYYKHKTEKSEKYLAWIDSIIELGVNIP